MTKLNTFTHLEYICVVMSDKNILNTIKSTVLSILPDAKVLLFGSRARGDYNKHSDFDVMVITKQNIPLKEKRNWRTQIRVALINAIHAPFDILLNSEDEIAIKKNLPGHVVRSAMNEGVFI